VIATLKLPATGAALTRPARPLTFSPCSRSTCSAASETSFVSTNWDTVSTSRVGSDESRITGRPV
jgi:hypothetical protein